MPVVLHFLEQPYFIIAAAALLSLIGAKQTSMNKGERESTAAAITFLGGE